MLTFTATLVAEVVLVTGAVELVLATVFVVMALVEVLVAPLTYRYAESIHDVEPRTVVMETGAESFLEKLALVPLAPAPVFLEESTCQSNVNEPNFNQSVE